MEGVHRPDAEVKLDSGVKLCSKILKSWLGEFIVDLQLKSRGRSASAGGRPEWPCIGSSPGAAPEGSREKREEKREERREQIVVALAVDLVVVPVAGVVVVLLLRWFFNDCNGALCSDPLGDLHGSDVPRPRRSASLVVVVVVVVA